MPYCQFEVHFGLCLRVISEDFEFNNCLCLGEVASEFEKQALLVYGAVADMVHLSGDEKTALDMRTDMYYLLFSATNEHDRGVINTALQVSLLSAFCVVIKMNEKSIMIRLL